MASAIFWQAEQGTTDPEHRHGGQRGVVLAGEIHLTVGSEPRTCRRGDEYYIPASVPRSASLKKGTRVIDFFDDPDRFRAKA